MRVVLLTKLRPTTYRLIAHLVERGVDLRAVCLEGSMAEGVRVKALRILESFFLWAVHVVFLRRDPPTEVAAFRRFGSVPSLLREKNIELVRTDDMNDDSCVRRLQEIKPDLFVVAGTRILKAPILGVPLLGSLNAHSSMLPKYRGGRSEFWMLRNKELQYAGVTVHWVKEKLDAGPIVLQEQLLVAPNETPQTLRAKAEFLSPILFAEAIRRLTAGEQLTRAQDESAATLYRAPTEAQIKGV